MLNIVNDIQSYKMESLLIFELKNIINKNAILNDKEQKINEEHKMLWNSNKINIVNETYISLLDDLHLRIITYKTKYNNAIKNVYNDYDKVIYELDNLKRIKTEHYKMEYNKYVKYIDYALEECETSYLFMMNFSNINNYNMHYCDIKFIDNTINTLIYNNIQKYTFNISTQIFIPEIYDMNIKINCYISCGLSYSLLMRNLFLNIIYEIISHIENKLIEHGVHFLDG